MPLPRRFVEEARIARHDPARDLLVTVPGRVRYDRRASLRPECGGALDGLFIRAVNFHHARTVLPHREHSGVARPLFDGIRSAGDREKDGARYALLFRDARNCSSMIARRRTHQPAACGLLTDPLNGVADPEDLESANALALRL